jgi:Thioredoxin
MIRWSGSVAFATPSVSALRAPPLALAHGSLIFLAFAIVLLFAVVFGYYTVKGSGISQTPYRHDNGPPESPSELAHDITQNVRNWERGTAGHRRRHRPAAVHEPVDPRVADALRRWRGGSSTDLRLEPPVGPIDHVYGQGSGPTVTIYLDLASEPCRSAWQLLADLADQHSMRLAVRHLPLADVHKLSLLASEILEAAGAQGQFFALLNRLARMGLSDERDLLEVASGLVADPERLRLEIRDARFRPRVVEHILQATASGARVIPELYIDNAHYGGELKTDALIRALADAPRT